MVSIILVSYNKWEVTLNCVTSIQKNVSLDYEIIIVDNNSELETVNALKNMSGIRLILNRTNRGFPAGCNDGLKIARGEYIWFLNNDTIVPPNSLERMLDVLNSEEEIGMVGPVSNRIHGQQQIPCTYTEDSEISAFAEETAKAFQGQTARVMRLVGFSMLLRKATLDQYGGLDESLGIGTFEDDDLCMRLIKNGYKLYIVKDAFIHHIGNVSFIAAGGYHNTGDRNQRIVSRRYGLTLPVEAVVNEKLLTLLPAEAKTYLHVECGAGALGLHLLSQNKQVIGLESEESKKDIAKNHYSRYLTYKPGESFALPEDLWAVDAVVFEQQIDHRNTLAVLESIAGRFAAKARIVIHIPRIVKEENNVFDTYFEYWNQDGYRIESGQFNHAMFDQYLNDMGFQKRFSEISELKGFFNRCSLERYNERADRKAEVIREWIGVYDASHQ